jgi:DNA-binding response OmpR family regulator
MTFDSPLSIPDAMTDFPGLSRAPAALLVRLHESKGRIVEYWTLQQAVEAVTGNQNTIDNVRSAAKRARKAISGKGKIVSASGVGYRLSWDALT